MPCKTNALRHRGQPANGQYPSRPTFCTASRSHTSNSEPYTPWISEFRRHLLSYVSIIIHGRHSVRRTGLYLVDTCILHCAALDSDNRRRVRIVLRILLVLVCKRERQLGVSTWPLRPTLMLATGARVASLLGSNGYDAQDIGCTCIFWW